MSAPRSPRHAACAAALLLLCALAGLSAPAPAAAQRVVDRAPLVVAAGDIACDPEDRAFNGGLGTDSRCRQMATADQVLALDPDAVLAVGDLQYEDALAWKFDRSYAPSWGRFKDITHPVPGNHEYFDGGAAQGYFDYFNGPGAFSGPAGDRDKGYYAFRLGGWHVVALNSICSQAGGCGPGSPQARWLAAELAARRSGCTLAYLHNPIAVSGGVPSPSIGHLWRVLQDAGVDVVVAGHAHHYERFAKLDHTGAPDPEHGIRQFIVGTGGKSLSRDRDGRLSEAMTTSTFGVLALRLRPDRYEWRFVRESGDAFSDSGSEPCQGPPPAQPPEAVTGPASAVRGRRARLTGSVDARSRPTTVRFEYGRTPAYGASTPAQAVPAAAGRRAVSARLSGLRRGRVYHYRVVATSAAGTVVGENRMLRAGRRSRYAEVVARTPGLAAHWRLGEDRGPLAFDATGRRVGEYAGNPRLARRGALVRDRDRAAGFDGAAASARLDTPLEGHRASIEGWFRWRGGPVLLRDDSSIAGWYIRDSRNRLSYRFGGAVFRTRRGITSVRDGSWHHVVATKDGDRVRLFLDGRRVHSGHGPTRPAPTAPWHVMRNGPFAGHARGLADDIAFYDRPLSRRTIRAHYRAGVRRRAPDTRLRAPSGPTNDANPVVRLRSTKRRSSLRCSLKGPEGGAAVSRPCRRSQRLGGLADGRYVFSAYAVARGRYPDPTPARTRFRVDTVTPQADVQLEEPTVGGFARRGLGMGVTCSERCSIRARLVVDGRTARKLRLSRGRAVEIGRATGRLAGPGMRDLRVRPSAVRGEARRRLRGRSSLPITVRVKVADPAGNARGVRRDLTLRR